MAYTDHIVVDGVQYDLRDKEAVSFEQEQTLTTAQQEQARENIGAGSEADVSELKSQMTNLGNPSKILNSDAVNVDLDISDDDGNVVMRLANGHIYTKEFDSSHIQVDAKVDVSASDATDVDLDIADLNGNVLLRLADGHVKTAQFDSANTNRITSSVDAIYYGEPSNNDVLFTDNDVSVGDVIVLIFKTHQSGVGTYIDIINKSNTRITYIGRASSGLDKNYIETYTIPENFGKAVAKFGDGGRMTVYAIAQAGNLVGMNLYQIWQNTEPIPALGNAMETAKSDIVDLKYEINNKLANPLFTTIEKYNAEHSGNEIVVETALVKGTTGNAGYRIPSTIITNNGTVLVCGTHMTNPMGDYGDFSIDVARKAPGGSWSISEVVPFDSSRSDYGSVLNNEFLADRTNNRIYLFYGTEKSNVVWWEVTTEDGDFRYIYSDDDGVNWSAPVSLKSLWDTDVYDYCIPSCTQGITLTNGTFVVPCFCKKGTNASNGTSYPLLLIKPPSGDWYFSSVASVVGINHLDECAVVEGTTANEIWLYCRPNTNYGNGANRGYNKFSYNIASDKFTLLPPSYFDTNRHNCFSINRITINSQLMYLMSFTDTHGTSRDNLTLWGSLDGNKWIRIYRINKQDTAGYSVLASYNGVIGVSYEDLGKISYQDISALSSLIYDSVMYYIERRITVQDRMQMLYNALNGIN